MYDKSKDSKKDWKTNKKNGRTFKSKKSNYRRKNSDESDNTQEPPIGANDPKWYELYPQLVNDSATHSFFNPVGNKFSLTNGNMLDPNMYGASITSAMVNVSMPGLCKLEFVPGYGYSEDFNSQINIAARNIYSFIRHANSGHSNYDPADLMMYLIAMDSAYMYYAWMVRLYGIARLYSPVNKYYPVTLMHANGVSFSEVQKNLADFREYINTFAAKIGNLVVPSVTSLSQRHQWMCANIFTDSGTSKAQSYMFVPAGFHVFSEITTETGTSLTFKPLARSDGYLLNVADIAQYGDYIINHIMGSEDAGIMSGDILKAFGTDGCFKIGSVDPGYAVTPVYSPEVLTQIQNASVFTMPDLDSLNVTQNPDTQSIVCRPTITLPGYPLSSGQHGVNPVGAFYTGSKIISMPVDNPTPEQVMVATRLAGCLHAVQQKEDNSVVYLLDGVGTEVISGCKVYTYPVSDTLTTVEDPSIGEVANANPIGKDGAINLTYADLQAAAELEIFEFHPCIYLPITTTDVTANGLYWARQFDVDNYTVLGPNEFNKMHEVALLSELTWTTVSTVQKHQ